MLLQTSQDFIYVFNVRFSSWAEDHNVIKIYEDIFIQQIKEYRCHKLRKSCGGICKPERHDAEFEVPVTSTEGRFLYVVFGYSNLVVAGTQINFSKYLEPESRSNISSTRGRGKEFFFVTRFNAR